MNLGYTESERAYEVLTVAQNQFDETFSIGANWKFFENLDVGLYGRYTEQEFPDINREQERTEYGLRASYRISKSLYTQFSAQKVDQKGSLLFDNYDGLNYSISLTYTLGNN